MRFFNNTFLCKLSGSRSLFLIFFLCLFLFLSIPIGKAEENTPIILGESCALSGPAENLGLEMRSGLLAAFSKINDSGGVNGREILLISRDDGYEPDRAVRNTLQLIENKHVFMLIGEVGTPTSEAVVPLIEKYKIPFFAPFTGAQFLRVPFRRYVINIRGSYFQEMEKLASYLTKTRKIKRIACFYQNDSFGFAGLQGIKIALKKRGMHLVSTGTYERNTVAVLGGLRDINRAKPEAVVLVGTYSACAEYIKLSKAKIKQNQVFCSISFVGAESLQKALGGYGHNVIVSQVVPFPEDTGIPIVREYIEAMGKYQHDNPISFVSLEGYIAGNLFGRIARAVQGDLTRENFIATMERIGVFDLGGLILHFGPSDHQGSNKIYLTEINSALKKIEE